MTEKDNKNLEKIASELSKMNRNFECMLSNLEKARKNLCSEPVVSVAKVKHSDK
jgi:hypothetical protein